MQGLPGRRGLALLIEAWSCRLSPAVKETEPPVVGLPGNVLALEKRKNITFEDRRILPLLILFHTVELSPFPAPQSCSTRNPNALGELPNRIKRELKIT
jgi:hypothetical protein